MFPRLHAGVWPESSVAVADTVTVTRAPFGGAIVDGVAVRLVNTGGVVSGGTTTAAAAELLLPAPSVHSTTSV
jgi:hypothetical protein